MSQNEYTEHTKLAEAKQMRKRADEDARLLSNRIALLKQEEMKAMKKIEETKRKAQEILNARNRNIEEQRKREDARKQKEFEDNLKMEENRKIREQKRDIKNEAKYYRFTKAFADANSVKKIKEKNNRVIEVRRLEELSGKLELKRQIKSQMRDAEAKKRKMIEEKREKARIDNERRIEEENRVRREREEEVSRMEQEELELIQRLQNTQLLQKSAYEDLENALAGQLGFPQ